jgi:hypothetical protein
MAVDQASLTFAGRNMASFVPTMNLAVQSFQNNYHSDGIGTPPAWSLRHIRYVGTSCAIPWVSSPMIV